MLYLLITIVAGLLLFLLGYYLGHQMGRTEHIRLRLNRDRRERFRQLNTLNTPACKLFKFFILLIFNKL